jgi:hypothetical protein
MVGRLVIVLVLVLVSCSPHEPESDAVIGGEGPTSSPKLDSDGNQIPPAPPITSGPLDPEITAALDAIWDGLTTSIDPADVAVIGGSRDARLGWLLSDLLRFFQGRIAGTAAFDAFFDLTGTDIPEGSSARPWRTITDYLIAWDVPAPPDYASYKERLFTLVEPGWQPFFDDPDADIDWRLISWGGVLIDDRPLGALDACPDGCIPALDDPPVVSAALASWYPDDGIVFGISINGDSRAYPKNIMEVHEMVNDTLGGRRIGMPYCTLCGSAQVFLTDTVAGEPIVLRTSGLLSRSNKVMFDLATRSMFDTFLGVGVSGPLQGLELEQESVVTTTWGQWKTEHPDTTIVAEDGGRGISYQDDPLNGRDDNGPIFPVGDVDPRLPVHEQVLGVIAPDGTVVAIPVTGARAALEEGRMVTAAGVRVELDAGGLRAYDASGATLAVHQAFWFAWSQFYPETEVWVDDASAPADEFGDPGA